MKMSVEKIRPQSDSASKVPLGLRRAAHEFERAGETEMSKRGTWRRLQDLPELRHCFTRTPQRVQRPSQIVARLGISRIDRDRALETGQRFGKISAGGKDHAEIVVRLGEIRLEPHRTGEQRRSIVPSQLMRKHACEMKRPGIARRGLTSLTTETLGIHESAGAMMRNRSRKQLISTANGGHQLATLTSFAVPITAEAEIDLAYIAIHPDRLIAGDCAR